jgi:hypothetical protein
VLVVNIPPKSPLPSSFYRDANERTLVGSPVPPVEGEGPAVLVSGSCYDGGEPTSYALIDCSDLMVDDNFLDTVVDNRRQQEKIIS